jgi:hypothetical protein
MKKIVLDTNFLIDFIRFKLDLKEIDDLVSDSYKLVALNVVMKELKKISESKTKESNYAKIALEFVKSKQIEILETTEKRADESILVLSDENTIVATDDAELRKKLKSLGIKTIYLRAKKHLAMS